MADSIEKGLKNIIVELVKLNKNTESGESGPSPAAQKQADEDKRGAAKKTNTLLATIAANTGGAAGGGGGPGPEDKKLGGMFGGVGRALGGLGSGIGKGIGGFMKGIGAAGAGAGKFAIAFPLFGVGIAGFAVAIGAATWVISKMMPSIAKGLQEFKDVDGSNLIKVGAGMGALGGGFAAMGAGGAIAGVGNLIGGIASGVGSLFGIKGGQEALIEKLKKFSKLKLNVKNIKGNAEAMVAYGVAMTAGGAGTAMQAIGTFAAGVFGGIGKALGAVPPLESLKIFAAADIDKAKVKNNAEAMVAYAGAMAAGAGGDAMKAIGGIFNVITTFTDGVSKLLGGQGTLDAQLDSLKKITKASKDIDGKKVKSVAGAMVWYAGAMAAGAGAEAMKAVGGMGNVISTFTDGVSKLLGGTGVLDTQLDSLKKITVASETIDGKKVKSVAGAMVWYAGAMAAGAGAEAMKAVGGMGNVIGTFTDGISKLLGGKGTLDVQLDSLKKITVASGAIDGKKVKNVAAAMVEYAGAMAAGAKGEAGKAGASLSGFVGSAVDGLTSFITGGKKKSTLDVMLASLQRLSTVEGIDGAKVKLIAAAMVDYSTAMSAGATGAAGKAGASISGFVGSAVDGLTSFITGGTKKSSLDIMLAGLQRLSKVEGVDGAKVKLIAAAMVDYSTAMVAGAKGEAGKAGTSISTFVGSAVDGLTSFITGGKKASSLTVMLTSLQTISKAQGIDGPKIKLVADAMVAYGEGMAAGAKSTDPGVMASISNFASGVVKGIGAFFGIGGKKVDPIANLKKFALNNVTKEEVAQIKQNTLGLQAYATAMTAAGAGAPKEGMWDNVGKLFGGIASSLTSFLGVGGKKSDPIENLKKFALKSITPAEVTQINSNAKGLQAYADATAIMANLKVDKGFGDAVGDLLSGIGSWFSSGGKEDPMAALDKFAAKNFDPAKVKKNVSALQAFANFKYNRKSSGLILFAKDLASTVPAIEAAIMGGEVFDKAGIGTGDYITKGLASDDIKYEKAVANISNLRSSLGLQTTAPTNAELANTIGSIGEDKLLNSIEALTAAISAGGGGNTTINSQTSNTTTGNSGQHPLTNGKFANLNQGDASYG